MTPHITKLAKSENGGKGGFYISIPAAKLTLAAIVAIVSLSWGGLQFVRAIDQSRHDEQIVMLKQYIAIGQETARQDRELIRLNQAELREDIRELREAIR